MHLAPSGIGGLLVKVLAVGMLGGFLAAFAADLLQEFRNDWVGVHVSEMPCKRAKAKRGRCI